MSVGMANQKYFPIFPKHVGPGSTVYKIRNGAIAQHLILIQIIEELSPVQRADLFNTARNGETVQHGEDQLTLNAKTAEKRVSDFLREAWRREDGQDVAEYAVMLAVMLAIAVSTIRLIGSNANSVFSSVASSVQ
jgi:Flp pilus assembly pilin Flp